MRSTTTYCFDTCIIIDFFDRYPVETFVTLIENVRQSIQSGTVISIEPVLDELRQGNKQTDREVEDLFDAALSDIFQKFDQNATDELLNITVIASAYRQKRKTKKNADPYLVAFCRAHESVLVTNDGKLAAAAVVDGAVAITFVEYISRNGWTF